MASIRKIGPNKWQAQICIMGVRKSAIRSTKAEASSWAADEETTIRTSARTGIDTTKTVSDAFEKYSKSVSSKKKTRDKERTRLDYLARIDIDGTPLGNIKLGDVTTNMLGEWRDRRIDDEGIKGASVARDLWLISSVFKYAVNEWKWCATNPLQKVTKPQDSPPRDRLISADEIDRICLSLGYSGDVETLQQRIAVAFLFAIETAMRAGEICGLMWKDVAGTVAKLGEKEGGTKNGTKRKVPLSPRAIELLGTLPKQGESCFNLSESQLDSNFRKARRRADIHEITFHDTRHEAITRLAKRINILDLARMVGHKDLKTLQIYYNETAEDIAKKL